MTIHLHGCNVFAFNRRDRMGWERLLVWVTGRVDEQLRLKVEYFATENRILRGQVRTPVEADRQAANQAGDNRKEAGAFCNGPNRVDCHAGDDTCVASKAGPGEARHVQDTSATNGTSAARFSGGLTDPAYGDRDPDVGLPTYCWRTRQTEDHVSHQTVKNNLEAHGLDPALGRVNSPRSLTH